MKKVVIIAALAGILLTVGCQENRQSQNNSTPTAKKHNVMSLREKANSILYASLSSNNVALRATAIEVVSETGRKDMMPSVVRLLKDESVEVRFNAAIAIGDMNYKSGALSVKPILKDKNPNMKIAAAFALTKMGKESLESVIYDHLPNSNPTIRANSALLIGKLGKKDALARLKWVLNDSGSSYPVKIQAIQAIAMLGVDKKTTHDRLWTLLVSKFSDDKISGIVGMRYLNTEDSRTAIGTMLIDEVPEIRLFAAEQLGRMSDFSGKSEVFRYFLNKRPSLTPKARLQADRLAAMAIGRIGGSELEKHLPMLLNSRDKSIQLRAAQAVLLLAK